MEYSNLFVCLMGIGTVFIGLVCLIALVSVMSAVVQRTESRGRPAGSPAPGDGSAVTPELIAAISSVIAEDLGADVSAIRIVSCRKV